jgi:hypothetical protein
LDGSFDQEMECSSLPYRDATRLIFGEKSKCGEGWWCGIDSVFPLIRVGESYLGQQVAHLQVNMFIV